MKRGFTIIELLVASLILGMLSTILGMVFNQSAVSWRTGTAKVANLEGVCDNMAALHDEADNVFVADGKVRRLVGLWKPGVELRERACDLTKSGSELSDDSGRWQALILRQREGTLSSSATGQGGAIWSASQNLFQNIGKNKASGSAYTYIVNVMSAGPDGVLDTYDDIWSFPDDFE